MKGIVDTQQATIQNQQAQLELLTDHLLTLQNTPQVNENQGASVNGEVWATYVRWGRTVCPDTAELVYEGNKRQLKG